MKLKTVFRCQSCGYAAPKWLGQCPECSGWNTLAEEVEAVEAKPKNKSLTDFSSEVMRLSDSAALNEQRQPTGISEMDRLLGGGIVKGQIILLAGPPGIGKSTLMLQIADKLSVSGKVLYVTGEESPGQVGSRAKRLKVGSGGIYLLSETNLQKIIEAFQKINPDTLILDSIQTVYHPEFTSGPGTVGQVRESAGELLRLCKPKGAVLFLLGHVTKEGALAGPKVLEHIVDTVLYFDTERQNLLRIVRAYKNRFGPTDEVGIFQMCENGLLPVEDMSACVSSASRGRPVKGRAFSIALEGTRPVLAEVQALVAPTRYPFPRRIITGLDSTRCQVLLAAVERHVPVPLDNRDVFISVAGGIKLNDTALDMAVCAAVISSAKDSDIAQDIVFIGEAGILGQTARVSWLGRRIAEAARLGFARAVVPALDKKERAKAAAIKTFEVEVIKDLLPYCTAKTGPKLSGLAN